MIQYFKHRQSFQENKYLRVVILFIIYIYSSLEEHLTCGILKIIWFSNLFGHVLYIFSTIQYIPACNFSQYFICLLICVYEVLHHINEVTGDSVEFFNLFLHWFSFCVFLKKAPYTKSCSHIISGNIFWSSFERRCSLITYLFV